MSTCFHVFPNFSRSTKAKCLVSFVRFAAFVWIRELKSFGILMGNILLFLLKRMVSVIVYREEYKGLHTLM